MSELNRERIIRNLERLVDKYGENGSYNTYCTLSDSLTLIKELADENFLLEQKRVNMFEILDAYGRGRTDAVRKFADYLKKQSFNCDPGNGFSFDAIDVDELDDYVKKFLEED
jgi:hypothetical protein